MSKFDSLDDSIIKLLERNAWQSSEELAKQLHVSSSTIRRRIRRLTQEGVMRAVAIADLSKTGVPLTAVLALNVELQYVDGALKAISALPEVKWVATTTGRFDVLALARFHSTDELAAFVRKELIKVKGLKGSETFVCLHVERGDHILNAI